MPGVGGSVPQTTGQAFSFANLLFHNGTNLATLTQAYANYDWVFLPDDNSIYFRNTILDNYHAVCTPLGAGCQKIAISPWEGYFIWSDYNNITMIVYP
ncbi:hypothetical protein A3K73_08650 [Candidatus Pacearchaeota archaeon RBG_13_36_9]|nr:MAG: hypothetical protein A3K73_08650 [Candidatus Pacearchaeota archaeon RBG_13_36_9]